MFKVLLTGLSVGLLATALSLPSFAAKHTVHVKMHEMGKEVCGRMTVNWNHPPAAGC
jgi:hypothetical protein